MRYAITAMICIQTGIALSVHLVDQLGATGVVWLRLAWSAVVLLSLARPGRRHITPTTIALGITTGALLLSFMAAAARMPLGTASAIEFLGPLTVAVWRGRGPGRIAWPLLAAAGVALLTWPWQTASPAGIGYATLAAACWAAYILLTQRAGDEATGLAPLAVSMPVAALVATAVTPLTVYRDLTPRLLAIGAGLAILVTVIPFALELLALRRLTATAFGVLMSLEPAIALLAGWAVLAQVPGWAPIAGIALVVTAGIGAARAGSRTGRPAPADAPAAF